MSYQYGTGASGSVYVPIVTPFAAANYDYRLGPADYHIQYVMENHRLQLRIGGEACYILRRRRSGSTVTDQTVSVWEYWMGPDRARYYRALVWDGQGMHPDFRPYIASEEDNVPFTVAFDGADATRVIDYLDLIANTEYALFEDKSTDPHRWFIVVNEGYDPRAVTVTYSYSVLAAGTDVTNLEPDRDDPIYFGSKYGWYQLTTPATDWTGPNQFLIRFPFMIRDEKRTPTGRILLDERRCWTLGEPEVRDRDIIVRPAITGIRPEEERYEITSVGYSFVRSMSTSTYYRLSQQFQVRRLEKAEEFYNIPLITE